MLDDRRSRFAVLVHLLILDNFYDSEILCRPENCPGIMVELVSIDIEYFSFGGLATSTDIMMHY